MAKKLSKFGAAFDAARKSGAKEFDFGGKKYNTKMKGEGKKSSSSLPKKTSVKPSSRAEAVKSMSKEPSTSGLSTMKSGFSYKPSQGGPSFRGGGPKIAMSQKNIDKRNANKKSGGFRDAMKAVAGSFKKQKY